MEFHWAPIWPWWLTAPLALLLFGVAWRSYPADAPSAGRSGNEAWEERCRLLPQCERQRWFGRTGKNPRAALTAIS